MKKILLKIGKVLLIGFLILLAIILICIVLGNVSEQKKTDSIISSRSSALSEALKEAWQNTPSDIEGMTKLDKYTAGLAVAAGSDTDGDGLTDKEELEVYHTDPLKVSTAGDLYSDLYKVENGMDVSSYYAYTGDGLFAHNECPEVQLSAEVPTDFNAVVTECPGVEQISGLQVYAAYEVYNYSGKFSVDLTDVLRRESIGLSDIAVYVSDGNSLDSYSYTSEDNTITLKKSFSPNATYKVYCAEKDFIRFAAARLGVTDALEAVSALTEDTPEEITGAGLVILSPLLTELLDVPITVYYERLGTEADSQTLKNKIVAHTQNFFGIEADRYSFTFKETSAMEIEFTYNLLKSAISFLDITNMSHGDITWEYIFFLYYSYEDKLAFEKQASLTVPDPSGDPEDLNVSVEDPVTGFDLVGDTLPFGNFKTEYSPNGSCAGISHLTAYLYNQKSFPTTSSAVAWDSDIRWELGDDPENDTLSTPGLGDFKNEAFVQEHSTDGQTLTTDLTPGEEEFAKMIAAAYQAGNNNAEFICYELFGGDFGTVTQDYAVIESAISYLESGKILDVYLDMVDGTRHTVNLFGYKRDAQNPNVVWFSVYDCNFPGNRTDGAAVSDTGFQLRVEKKLCASGNGYTFAFDYFPLEDRSYGATSNPNISENNLIIILDEFGHLLND